VTRRKKIKGIKRHIMVDTLGLLLVIVVRAAIIRDRDGAKLVFARVKNRFPAGDEIRVSSVPIRG